MEQIRLDHQLPVKKTDHTSKGDQLKWKIGNIWYKSDYMGYEGLSETLVSHLLQKSTLSHPFVLYQPVRIAYRGTLRSGCSSPDFLKANQMLIPLEKLYRQNTGDSLAISLAAFSEPDHTSKGDQLKWKIGNIWYKSDYMGYEGLSETLVSHLLQKSTLSHPFVLYQPVRIAYRGTLRSGCSSPDFLKANQMLIPLEKLYRQNTGDSLAISLAAFSEPAERIRFLADQLENMTGIQNFGAYLTAMLEIDAFFLNEDRHTNNIAVLYDTETEQYSLSPLFDQGLCLFADTSNDYPLDLPMDVCMERIEAKPFSSDFDTQLDAAEELYGIQLHFSFTTKDVCTELASLADYYPLEIRQRVEQIIRRQMRKYGYLMRS